MTHPKQTSNTSRQPMAVMIWTLQVVSLTFVAIQPTFALAVGIELFISMASCLALMLIAKSGTIAGNSNWRQQIFPLAISIGIVLAWAQLLGCHQSNLALAMINVIGVAPLATIWMTVGLPFLAIKFPPTPAIVVKHAPNEQTSGTTISESAGSVETCIPNDHSAATSHQEVHPFELRTHIAPTNHLAIGENSLDQNVSPALNITQWQQRSITNDGEMIEGGVRVEFEEGQRDVTIHVAFCPPFLGVPHVTTEDLDGGRLEIRVAAIYPFGARLTIRRPSTSTQERSQSFPKHHRIAFVANIIRAKRAA